MHAISAARLRQLRIRANQQNQPARAASIRKFPRRPQAVFRAKMPINNGRSARQPPRHCDRIRCALWIGEEKQRRNSWSARIAVEPRRRRR